MSVDLLALLDAFVKQDPSPPGLLGEVAVGIAAPGGDRARWWRASFKERVSTELTDRFPKSADSVLLLGEEDAASIVATGAAREDEREVYFKGDKQLMKRFLERYLAGAARGSGSGSGRTS